MICKESGNIRQRGDYLPSLICLNAQQRKWKHQAERKLPSFTSLSLCSANKVEASNREKTTYLHFHVPMLCNESGNIRQGEDYLASLLCPYALQRKWKHQAEIRLPSFASLSPMLCKESGNIRQREDYLASLLCLYDLQRKWKHQAERRLPIFTSLSLCSVN